MFMLSFPDADFEKNSDVVFETDILLTVYCE